MCLMPVNSSTRYLFILGVPFTTKETTACKGLSSSFGLVSRKGERAREDAELVALMKKAGGILLGKVWFLLLVKTL